MMPKVYYKKRRTYSGRDKYSVEQRAGYLEIPAAQQAWAVVVPDSSVEGMRKVKHITVSLAHQEVTTEYSGIAYWALVYVPQGTTPNTMTLSGTTSMYEPNQFVMNAGVVDFPGGPVVKTPCFHCSGHSLDPWLRTKIPHADDVAKRKDNVWRKDELLNKPMSLLF